ncbi:MAG: flagellar biosynthesis protein FliQ [Gammaproteobacteria bacterium]|jgi:flagellar biosynthesis protein FliQ
MDVDAVMEIGRQAMWISILLTVPLLGASLIVGLVIAIFQAATSINEMTLTFVPKLMTIGLVLLFAGHWMITQLVDYTTQLIENIPFLIG